MATQFAPELFVPSGTSDISFYEKAFGATENFRFTNEDQSIHVAELVIDGQVFHIHESGYSNYFTSPENSTPVTVCIGLFCNDPDACFNAALAAGAIMIQPMKSHDYGYRQGMLRDPFGHIWQIQKRL